MEVIKNDQVQDENVEQIFDDYTTEMNVIKPEEEVSNEIPIILREGCIHKTGIDILDLRGPLERLFYLGYIPEGSKELCQRMDDYIQQLQKIYSDKVIVDNAKLTEYNEQVVKLFDLYGDKDPNGKVIMNKEKVVITDESRKNIFDNSVHVLTEEYNDVITAIQNSQKLIDYVLQSYNLTQKEYDYIITGIDKVDFEFPCFDDIKIILE